MTERAAFAIRNRNPDVLTCIANLSNDEVFTPPELANQLLDNLERAWARDNAGAYIWRDPKVTFIDPFTKSGVFLREIASRLVEGLADEIPDLQQRVNHVLTKQIFGIGITRLTTLLARRSLYCSKHANGKHSICTAFDGPEGHIWFEPSEHSWEGATEFVQTADGSGPPVERGLNGHCKFCGASQLIMDRGDDFESHSYAFIHTDDVGAFLGEIFGVEMQFDVVIGNPPYQMTGGAGGSSDSSIYHLFVEQALNLDPRYLTMVIPSRWLAGGRGLGEFRKMMLQSRQISTLVDYPVSKEVFPGVEVKGGVCHFLWERDFEGECAVSVVRGQESSEATRELGEFDVFVREPIAAGILRKVLAAKEDSVLEILTADTPFGIATNFSDFSDKPRKGDVALYYVRTGRRGVGYIPRGKISKNEQLIEAWKVLVPKAGSDGGQKIPDSVLGKPQFCPPPSVCTQTFLAFTFETEEEAKNFETYYRTRFFRFLVSLRKITQDALRPMYGWVPMQSWNHPWSDETLFKKYALSKEERAYVESVIRPMEPRDD